jgi:hypothetical protein
MKGAQQHGHLRRKDEAGPFNGTRSALDSESVVSSMMSTTSNMTEIASEEVFTCDESSRSLQLNNNFRRSRASTKRKQRRQRGISLERQILRLMLRTASAGAVGAHFEVETSPPSRPVCSPQDILKDLASDKETWRYLHSCLRPERATDDHTITKGNMVPTNPPILKDELSIQCNELRQQEECVHDPSLNHMSSPNETEQEPGIREGPEGLPEEVSSILENIQTRNTDFMPMESFESVSWREKATAMNPGTRWSTSTESPSKTTVKSELTRGESVVFKTNFEEWNKFEPDAFLPVQCADTLLNYPSLSETRVHSSTSTFSFTSRFEEPLTTRKTKETNLLSYASPRSLPRIMSDGRWAESRPTGSSKSSQRMQSSVGNEYELCHPESPDSIFDHPAVATRSTQFRRSNRVDPPASHYRQFYRNEVSRITI